MRECIKTLLIWQPLINIVHPRETLEPCCLPIADSGDWPILFIGSLHLLHAHHYPSIFNTELCSIISGALESNQTKHATCAFIHEYSQHNYIKYGSFLVMFLIYNLGTCKTLLLGNLGAKQSFKQTQSRIYTIPTSCELPSPMSGTSETHYSSFALFTELIIHNVNG